MTTPNIMVTYSNEASVILTLSEFLTLQVGIWDAICAARDKGYTQTAHDLKMVEAKLYGQIAREMAAAAKNCSDQLEKMKNNS